MTLPGAYTEPGLARFMARVLGPSVTATLGWHGIEDISDETDAGTGEYVNLGEYEEPVNETLLALKVDDLAEWTGRDAIQKLRAVARWQVWRHARQSLSDAYDESEGNLRYSRHQLYEMAMRNEREAYAAAAGFIPSAAIVVDLVPVAEPDDAEAEFG